METPKPGKTVMISQTLTVEGLDRQTAESRKDDLCIGIGSALAVPPENIEITRIEMAKGSSSSDETGQALDMMLRRRRILGLEDEPRTSLTYEVAVTEDMSRPEVEGKMEGKNTAGMTARLQVALDNGDPGSPHISVAVTFISEPVIETEVVTADGEAGYGQIRVVTENAVEKQKMRQRYRPKISAQTEETPGLTVGVMNVNPSGCMITRLSLHEGLETVRWLVSLRLRIKLARWTLSGRG